jgi:predicted membrane protein
VACGPAGWGVLGVGFVFALRTVSFGDPAGLRLISALSMYFTERKRMPGTYGSMRRFLFVNVPLSPIAPLRKNTNTPNIRIRLSV